MKATLPLFANATLAAVAVVSLTAAPSFAQAQAPGQSADRGETRGSGGGASVPAAAPHASSAPSAPSGGGGSTGSSGGNYGVSRGGDSSGSGYRAGSSTGGATGSSGSGGGSGYAGQGGGARPTGGRAVPRDGGSVAGGNTGSGGGSTDGVPTYARPRDGHTPIGTAAPRGSVPPAPPSGGGIYVPGGGYYPGYGYGYYDPWGYGAYYGGFYDPWYGGYPTYPQATYSSNDEGSLKLKIKPSEAEVYVDGYFVGIVDDFDGIFQSLHLDSGAHRIEVRANGYETLAFDVRITPEHTTTYKGELKRLP
jgi:hypothetical protein